MSLETTVATWRHKVLVDDTVVFGGDLAGTGAICGGFSRQRAHALVPATDRIELDLVFDSKTNGNTIIVGLAISDSATFSQANSDASWQWGFDQHLGAFEASSLRADVGVVAAPMAARIIYEAGVLTWRSGNGADVLRFTSARSSGAIQTVMLQGLSIDVTFLGTGGSVHATLKAGDSAAPEIAMDGSTGRLGLFELVVDQEAMVAQHAYFNKFFEVTGFPSGKPRPTEGKIWPRNY